MTVRIRLEEQADRPESLQVERSAFDSEEEPAIVESVRDFDGSFALVAEEDGRVVGLVQFSRAWIGDIPSWRSVRSAFVQTARGTGSGPR